MATASFDKANICFDCENACGGCSWTEFDPVTRGTRFKVPEGAVATPVYDRNGIFITYSISVCPLFIESPPRNGTHGELPESANPEFFSDPQKYIDRYFSRLGVERSRRMNSCG